MPINAYASRKYNIEKGESIGKVEIKYDSYCTETRNLYIETHEKKRKSTEWHKSGIYRNDNSIYWFIGNYEKAYLFVKEQLRWFCERKDEEGNNIFKTAQTQTSKGFLIPITAIKEYSFPLIIQEFDFTNKNHKKIIRSDKNGKVQ